MFTQTLRLRAGSLGLALALLLGLATPLGAVSDYVTYAFYDDSEARRPVVVSQSPTSVAQD